MENFHKIAELWSQLYGAGPHLDAFLNRLHLCKEQFFKDNLKKETCWYENAVIYSLYVDLAAENFQNLIKKLPYFQKLGVDCLWLLPILESPMRDAGYDVSDYLSIQPNLVAGGTEMNKEERLAVFHNFIEAAHQHNIRIIFDLVLNHCSQDHPFFQEAAKDQNSLYYDYFIWNEHPHAYKEVRIIFEGLCDSNWQYHPAHNNYYFHRFYPFQPDWNYRNHKVLEYIIDVAIFWKKFHIDGFRLDAVPYLWKEEGTSCENLEHCHTIVRLIRAVLDYLEAGTLLLAEACQPIEESVKYFGQGDECQAAYHFPLMRRIFASLATEDPDYIKSTIEKTPSIPSSCRWFLFLRCHDELTLEMTEEPERILLHNYYCQKPSWDFRLGKGIASRLYHLMGENPQRILLAYSILFTLPFTPIIYYQDEVAAQNDLAFYEKMCEKTGYPDSRNLARGPVDWSSLEQQLLNPDSPASKVYSGVQHQITTRRRYPALFKGKMKFFLLPSKYLLAYYRYFGEQSLLIIHNLSEKTIPLDFSYPDALTGRICHSLGPYEFVWLEKNP